MEDKFFKFSNVQFPLTDGYNLPVETIDPLLNRVITRLVEEVNYNLQARWSIEANRAGVPYPKPIAQAIPYPVIPLSRTDGWQFPLLSVSQVSSSYELDTIHKYSISRTFQLVYILEPLTSDQSERIYPFLRAVESVLVKRIMSGVDRNEVPLWKDLNVEKLILVSGEYGKVPELSTNQYFPTFSLTFRVLEQESPGEENFEDFDGMDASIDLAFQSEETIPDFIKVRT